MDILAYLRPVDREVDRQTLSKPVVRSCHPHDLEIQPSNKKKDQAQRTDGEGRGEGLEEGGNTVAIAEQAI